MLEFDNARISWNTLEYDECELNEGRLRPI
jgi:hypothetical protein